MYTPEVPTPGKKEQSLAATLPRTGPGPQGGCSCSSLDPAMRSSVLVGSTAIVGSFCLLVGNTAEASDPGWPATCGELACASPIEVGTAPAVPAVRAMAATTPATMVRRRM